MNRVGGNFRLDALQAAILLKKLPHLADWSERRWAIAQHYRSEFANIAPDCGCRMNRTPSSWADEGTFITSLSSVRPSATNCANT